MKVYGVRNRDGQWFRSKGYGGYGPSWVDELERAKLYAKIGQARSRVTFFAREFPSFGTPDLVEFSVVEIGPLASEKERAAKAIERIERKEAAYQERKRKWEAADREFRQGAGNRRRT